MEKEGIPSRQERALKAAVEAIVYVADEPVTVEQIVQALEGSRDEQVRQALQALQQEYWQEGRGMEIREIAGGYKMFTKPEHHETIRKFVKDLKPSLKLSMAALETLAAIAYRQPVTLPEIQEIRGVHAAGVLKTLLEKKLITTAGRKHVLGRPILYKTTKEFLLQFGLSSLQELPSLQEFEELARAAMSEPFEGAQKTPGPAETLWPSSLAEPPAPTESLSEATGPSAAAAEQPASPAPEKTDGA